MVAASFIGVALVGAGLGALAVTSSGRGSTATRTRLWWCSFAVAGAWLATWLQRYVTIIGTAFGGAWAVLVGALAVTGDKAKLAAAAAGDVWVPTRCSRRPARRGCRGCGSCSASPVCWRSSTSPPAAAAA